MIQIRSRNPLQSLPGKGHPALRGIAAKNLGGNDADFAHTIQHRRLDGEMIIFLGSVLDAHKHRLAIHFGIPGEMIALTGSGTQFDGLSTQLPLHRLTQLTFDLGIRLTTRLRAMKRRRAITFPIVNIAPAHAFLVSLDFSTGCKRHQVVMTLPTSVGMKALNTAGTAASDIDEMLFRWRWVNQEMQRCMMSWLLGIHGS